MERGNFNLHFFESYNFKLRLNCIIFQIVLMNCLQLSLLIAASAALLSHAVADSMWESYEKVLAKRLGNTFKSTSTLQENYNFITTKGDSTIGYGCSNYTAGSAIGKNFIVFIIDSL